MMWGRGLARAGLMLSAAVLPMATHAETPAETAAAFGAREGVEQLSLSPDGTKIAFLAPAPSGQGSTLYTVSTAEGATPAAALSVDGKPDRLENCRWVSETRLVCTVYGVVKAPDLTLPLPYTRLFAVDAAGGNQRLLTNVQTNHQDAVLGGGQVIDWLPGQDGKVMMSRYYQKTEKIGTNVGSSREGLGVDIVDTRDGSRKGIEQPKLDAAEYITDGRGAVRIAGFRPMRGETGQVSQFVTYRFRKAGQSGWGEFSTLDTTNDDGFNPYAVDAEKDVAYGFRKVDGRLAVFAKALDGSGTEKLILSRPDVDVDGLVMIGRNRRVVGASFITDTRQAVYFDPTIKSISDSLHKALPKLPLINIVDASVDENKLLIFAGSDQDPGRYYLFDRAAKRLQILMLKRPQLEGHTLATQKPVSFKAADGTVIPAYLTLPPGKESAKGLPAIVLPHGGPASRDEWGFDWLPQYFAARGYAVLQPEFRGSSGYGDDYFLKNGFQSWRTSISDVADAGTWLVAQGVADPAKLAVFGWSYGGYAALQVAVMRPDLFKAVVAVAPVADLARLKDDSRGWANYRIMADYIGSDPTIVRDGSPAQNAAKIKAPVLLAHGTVDRNVAYGHSTMMESRLRAAGGKVELMSFPDLDHYLEDSSARTKLLEHSDAFIRAAIGN
jgi:dipeptidyl aminopeptidase/acylaminoacyl peptidase